MAGADIVGIDYFQTLRSVMIRGRSFQSLESAPVAIVNATLADRTWPGQDPIGKQLVISPVEMNVDEGAIAPSTRTVVGVVANTKWAMDAPPWPEVYVPFDQNPLSSMEFIVRCSRSVNCGERLREAVSAIDADVPLYSSFQVRDRIAKSLAPQRLQLVSVSTLAGLALLVSVLGLYSVMSFLVSSQRSEIGVRIALGARPRDVLNYVFHRSCILIGAGVVAGAAASIVVSPLMSAALFGVSPYDMTILLSAIVMLIAVALLGTYIPARRAAKLDQVSALRVG